MRVLSLVLLAFITLSLQGQTLPSWARDCYGAELKERTRSRSMPSRVVEENELKDVLFALDLIEGKILNRFSNNIIETSEAQASMSLLRIVPASWTTSAGATTSAFIKSDLYNLFPCELEIISIINKGYGPGEPQSNILLDNGVVRIGETDNGIGVWSLPEEYAGEIARAYLYMASLYPITQWDAQGPNFFEDNEFPTIKKSTLDYLLELHFLNPPGQREIERNERIREIQGNANPFVIYPELAYFIWQYEGDNETPDMPEEPVQLKASYSYGADEWVWLKSPYVAEDAVWKVDGAVISDSKIKTSELSTGLHLLEFESALEKGTLLIEITE